MIGVIVLFVALCGAGTYLGYTMIVKEGKKLENAKLLDAVADKKLESLEQAKKDIAEYEELESIAKRVVPQEKDQARTVLEIVNLARKSGISIVNVTFPESALGEVKAKGSKKPATARGNEEADALLTQLTPVEGLSGVYAMDISVEADQNVGISYEQLIDFLDRLEKNRRTAQVGNLTITPNSDDTSLITFTLTLRSYVKP